VRARFSLQCVTARREELARARDLLAAIDARVVDEQREWSGGVALLTPSLPKVWDANYLRLDEGNAAGADALASEAAEIAAGAGIDAATILVEDDETAHDLAPRLRDLGFDTTRLVLMSLRRTPAPPETVVVEPGFDAVAASRREIMLEAFPGDDELADQLMELDRRLQQTVGGRWFAVREGGRVASRAWLRGDAGLGQVEDVATAIAARGRGLARAVVSAAARTSVERGDELTFVIADADETTPELYRKLGFEAMGLTHRFVRQLR
jgi:ribosomal protein S18 acetylase RimI-like enzyme/nucleotide-binding universal stress UspA family protein